jgi:hypothetical protein
VNGVIDGLSAAAMVNAQASLTDDDGPSVYETRGLIEIG